MTGRTMPRSKSSAYLITRVHVVVGDGEEIHEADVLVSAGRVARVSATRLEAGDAHVVDGRGKTLMPGLIDAHAHLDFLSTRSTLHGRLWTQFALRRALRELLEHGVTSIRCMGDPLALVTGLRRYVGSRPASGPRMVVAGPVLTAPGGHPAATVAKDNRWLRTHMAVELDDADRARATVRRLRAAGVDVIKLVYQGGTYGESRIPLGKLRPGVMAAIVDEAHVLGLPVSAHTHHTADVEELLAAGVDAFEHGVLEDDLTGSGITRRWAASEAWLIPTLQIAALVRDGEGRFYHDVAARNLLLAHQAGVRIAAGTDSMIGALPPTSLHEELRLMTAAGIPPADVLRMATYDAARCIGLADRGLVAEGYAADLLLLGSNPLEQIENVGDISRVLRDGQQVHRVEPAPQPDLASYIPPEPALLNYRDDTGATVGTPAFITYDTMRFGDEKSRRITYADVTTGEVLRTDSVTSGPDLATLTWSCSIPGEGTDITAERSGPNVALSGRFQGKGVTRVYPLRGRLWLQTFFVDAATFIRSPMEQLLFVSIGTTGRGALTMTDFELTKTGQESLTDAHGKQLCVTTRLVMPQWRRFWAALGWYDQATGDLVQQRTKGRATELVRRYHGRVPVADG